MGEIVCSSLAKDNIRSANILTFSEAWRYTGPFTRWNRFRGLFPGFGIGLAAFGAYMVYEQMFLTSSHGHGHEEGHH